MKTIRFMAGIGAIFMAASIAVAGDDVAVSTDARAIVEQQQQIRSDATDRRGRYRDMDERTRTNLLSKQDQVFSLLDGKEQSTELSQGDQLALFNTLEEISAIVNQAEDERMICERVRPTGSNRPVNVCKTVAQRRLERDSAEAERNRRDVRCEGACENASDAWR